MTRKVFAVLISLIFVIGIAFAQARNGTVSGMVLDQTQARIPGVTLTLSNLGKNEVVRAISQRDGGYSFDVAPGSYELKAELPGFQTTIVGPIQVKEGETSAINVTMRVGR